MRSGLPHKRQIQKTNYDKKFPINKITREEIEKKSIKKESKIKQITI
jgi:hypothetical protein